MSTTTITTASPRKIFKSTSRMFSFRIIPLPPKNLAELGPRGHRSSLIGLKLRSGRKISTPKSPRCTILSISNNPGPAKYTPKYQKKSKTRWTWCPPGDPKWWCPTVVSSWVPKVQASWISYTTWSEGRRQKTTKCQERKSATEQDCPKRNWRKNCWTTGNR